MLFIQIPSTFSQKLPNHLEDTSMLLQAFLFPFQYIPAFFPIHPTYP
jgi:hypothetical protein